MTTIKDVAQRAGVSVATVSHVMNNSRAVSVEARDKVQAAIVALKYRRDGIARSLRVSHTGTIALMISDITNPFFAEMVRGIEDCVHTRGKTFNILLCNTEENDERERRALDMVLEKRIDGIIIVPTGGNAGLLQDLVDGGLPIVLADRHLPGLQADAVIVDNRPASFAITDHLIRLGHRRIGALTANLDANSIRDRVAGYRDALESAGLPSDSRLMVGSHSSIDAAVEAGFALLDLRPAPTALFGTNNFMTLGLVRAVLERGLRCPDDISIVGFDDFPWAASFQPRLTVIEQPSFAIGQEAAGLLLDRISRKRQGTSVTVTLQTRLIVRDSSRPLAANAA